MAYWTSLRAILNLKMSIHTISEELD